ncbi:MAG: Gldg family protein [Planctomycetaceae bacterium]|jgi:ABC-2 type transport system permease protein|nr:Gldg family protein [Planctomycetaceae bacterium]
MNISVIYSVFKRNFFGYLANPTGYVFICVFVLLSSIAAFLTDEFFNANLANLDQLNTWFPLIMLVFVPAITMGIWADERRQGTDELLLTVPASDFDIVIGKYKAAVSIYTVSLLFSFVCNFLILKYLGSPDIGLFLCTYLGYYLTGCAMIAIGMTASFFTGNLTVAYILGAIFNTPLIVLKWTAFADFSIPVQLELFGRGIVSVSGIVYFAAVAGIMLYLSMILIGRRHWTARRKFSGTLHYSLRAASLFVIVLSLVFLFRQHDLRADLTEEKLSTLSPEARKLLKELKPQYPVVIEAFLSADVPESHTQTRHDIVSILDEIQSICGKNVSVRPHYNMKTNTEEALIANQRFTIKSQDVSFAARGKREFTSIFLGVAFRSGLNSLNLPFIDRGLSVEYELVHALYSVTQPQKKRIGILKTDAPLYGRFDMQTFSMSPPWQIVEELQKQYDVTEVDPAQPIIEKYDALVAVQPSALGDAELTNFIAAVQSGQPTVIFEDPLPVYVRVPGTAEPRQQGGNPMMMRGQQPKGNIEPLWNLLGVSLEPVQAVWQDYSPIRKLQQIPKGFVFLDRSLAAEKKLPFNTSDAVTSSLQYMMLPFPGRFVKSPSPNTGQASPLTVETLLTTFQQPAGIVLTQAVMQGLRDGSWERQCIQENVPEHLAMRITGELPAPPPAELKEGETPKKPEPAKINVLLVADIDLLSDMLFNLRKLGNEPGSGINLNFDNVTFVLNVIDNVAGDDRFLTIRNRRPKHRTLSKFDEMTDDVRKKTADDRKRLQEEFETKAAAETKELESQMQKLETEYKSGAVSEDEVVRKLLTAKMSAEKRLETEKEKAQRELNIQLEKADVVLNEYIRRVQGYYKFWAVTLPPLPPLLIAFGVYFIRRVREREGIPASRRRK